MTTPGVRKNGDKFKIVRELSSGEFELEQMHADVEGQSDAEWLARNKITFSDGMLERQPEEFELKQPLKTVSHSSSVQRGVVIKMGDLMFLDAYLDDELQRLDRYRQQVRLLRAYVEAGVKKRRHMQSKLSTPVVTPRQSVRTYADVDDNDTGLHAAAELLRVEISHARWPYTRDLLQQWHDMLMIHDKLRNDARDVLRRLGFNTSIALEYFLYQSDGMVICLTNHLK